jgi:hypothetical protein
MNIHAMLELLDHVYHKVSMIDTTTSEWKYYDGLKAMASVAIGKPICMDSTGHHYAYNA